MGLAQLVQKLMPKNAQTPYGLYSWTPLARTTRFPATCPGTSWQAAEEAMDQNQASSFARHSDRHPYQASTKRLIHWPGQHDDSGLLLSAYSIIRSKPTYEAMFSSSFRHRHSRCIVVPSPLQPALIHARHRLLPHSRRDKVLHRRWGILGRRMPLRDRRRQAAGNAVQIVNRRTVLVRHGERRGTVRAPRTASLGAWPAASSSSRDDRDGRRRAESRVPLAVNIEIYQRTGRQV
jgi:hypothetical protein